MDCRSGQLEVRLTCGCGADLSEFGAVEYVERYSARLLVRGTSLAIHPVSATVSSEARCRKCECPLRYSDVDFDV